MTTLYHSWIVVTVLIGTICANTDFYSHSINDADGTALSLEKYRGKVTLVVNVASECGFTDKHYKGMVRARDLLGKNDKFEILAFPCNQFGAQEPKDIKDILEFAKTNYKVNFPIFAKINVKENDVPDAWKYLIAKSQQEPTWNFWKFLVNHNGEVLGAWGPWSDIEEIFPAMKSAVDSAVNQKEAKMPFVRGREPGPPSGSGASTSPNGRRGQGQPPEVKAPGGRPPIQPPEIVKPPRPMRPGHDDL